MFKWQERSDWINVKTDINPPALGDGKTDDTAALQKAFDSMQIGQTLYFPSGNYRITSSLTIQDPKKGRRNGISLIGDGRDTKFTWDGPAGADMVFLNGVTASRLIGMNFDGKGVAANGFHYKSTQGFQTEMTHQYLAFRGFTDAAILENHNNQGEYALAETTFENCLFEDNAHGIGFLRFNDYDYTITGCEFRNNGEAITCNRGGNFYIRDCHFEGSKVLDIRDWSEHASSIRRCTSVNSATFLYRRSEVAPITVQDCQISGWTDPRGAIILSRPPVTIFDCVFSNPGKDANGAPIPPIGNVSEGQRLILSNNRLVGAPSLFAADAKPQVYNIAAGKYAGCLRSASQTFFRENPEIPGKVFDAKVDFQAKGDGTVDDTAAIQKTIDAAAAAGKGAIAYLPTGTYNVTATLNITGKDYYVGGSGWATKLRWTGPEGGTMVKVDGPQNVTLENILVGATDAGKMNNGIDILQVGNPKGSRMTYAGVFVYGMYQKQPEVKGLRFSQLTNKDVVIINHVQGNMRFTNSARATVLANVSYEGSIIVEGKEKLRDGFLGIQTRLATSVTHGLYLHNNNKIVTSDFYIEQGDDGYLLDGDADDPPGRATLSGAKIDFTTNNTKATQVAFDVRNYRGQIFCGPYQFYQTPKRMHIRQQGTSPVELYFLGCAWYGTSPDIQVEPSAKLFVIGNESYGLDDNGEVVTDQAKESHTISQPVLDGVSAALDDLRRLGELDLRLNFPEVKLTGN